MEFEVFSSSSIVVAVAQNVIEELGNSLLIDIVTIGTTFLGRVSIAERL